MKTMRGLPQARLTLPTPSNRILPPVAVLVLFAALAAGVGAEEPKPQWRSLFDGQSLDGWKITNFGGEGEVLAEDGKLILEMGNSLTGVTYRGELPKTNYEVEFDAQRMEGIDFFCGFTFPVADSHCSFIVGGWAGAVVGLSSIDGKDASMNETTRYMKFENNRWYHVSVRVTPERITCTLDGKVVVDQDIRDRKITTRREVDPSKPFGFSAWETKAALKNIRLRELKS